MRSGRSRGVADPDGGPAVTACWSELESGGGGHHRCPPGVHGGDDLLGVDPLQVDAGGAEVGVPELALDDVERDVLAGELERMRVAQLVRRKAAPDPGRCGEPAELAADRCVGPRPSARGAVDDAEQRTDWQLNSGCEPRAQLLPAPLVHADLAPAPALTAANQNRSTPSVEVVLPERERFLDTQPGAPQDDDNRAPAASRDSHRWRDACPPRSPPPSVGRPGTAFPCCAG